jgi:hypothetical protein
MVNARRALLCAAIAGMIALASSPARAQLIESTFGDSGIHTYPVNAAGTPSTPSSYTQLTIPGSPNNQPIFPGGVARDSSGNLYLSSVSLFAGGSTDRNIYEFSSTGAFQRVFAHLPVLNDPAPQATAVQWHDGSLYVADFLGGVVEKFDSSGADHGPAIQIPDGVGGIGFDNTGTLYAAGFNSGNIYKAGSATTYIDSSTLAPSERLAEPGALLFDANNNLYVSNGGGDKIEKFNSSGGFVSDLATSASLMGYQFPSAMIFSQDGNSILVTMTGTNELGPTGALLQVALANGDVTLIEGNLLGPTGLVYAPEPGSFVLAAAAGIAGLAGVAARKRRRHSGNNAC